MKAYLVMEMMSGLPSMPLAAYSSATFALAECKRLAHDALLWVRKKKKWWRVKRFIPSDHQLVEIYSQNAMGKKKVKLRLCGFGIYTRKTWLGEKKPTSPGLHYYVEEFELDQKAESFPERKKRQRPKTRLEGLELIGITTNLGDILRAAYPCGRYFMSTVPIKRKLGGNAGDKEAKK